MCHGDDDGIRLPPRIAPKQIVILPIVPKPEQEELVLSYVEHVAKALKAESFGGQHLVVHIDKRDKRGGEKSWEWIKKGIPLRLEIGPRDVEAQTVVLARRDKPPKEKVTLPVLELLEDVAFILEEIQQTYYEQAKAYLEAHTYSHLETFEELKAFFTPKNEEKPEIHGGFVLAKWCGDPATEEWLKELKLTIRCLPCNQSGTKGCCILTGREATLDAIFAKSY